MRFAFFFRKNAKKKRVKSLFNKKLFPVVFWGNKENRKKILQSQLPTNKNLPVEMKILCWCGLCILFLREAKLGRNKSTKLFPMNKRGNFTAVPSNDWQKFRFEQKKVYQKRNYFHCCSFHQKDYSRCSCFDFQLKMLKQKKRKGWCVAN